MTIYEAMIHCIKSEINSSCVEFDINLSDSEIKRIYEISKHHDLVHIVGNALIKNKIFRDEKELYDLFQKRIMFALYQYEKSNYEFNKIVKLFEKEEIKFIPLKGIILRNLYPERWMRTSSDIDILIEKENIKKATECLLAAGLKIGVETPNDITFITSSGGHIELHHNLIEDDRISSSINSVLGEVWAGTTTHEGYLYWNDMNDEMFYFYHIAHMAKHFLFGGCGVKPFIDLWILDNLKGIDCSKRDELLKQGNLFLFAEAARKLSKIWFENEEYDSVSKQIETFVLRGGVYGSAQNRILVQQQKKGGRIKYLLSKIFIPYDILKFNYPILKKYRFLTPFMQVCRWYRMIFCEHLRRVKSELYYNNISNKEAANIQELLENIGL